MSKYIIYNKGKFLESEHVNKNIRMFEACGAKCEDFWNIPSLKQLWYADIMYLNWYENIYKGAWPIAVGQYLAKLLVLCFSKMRGVKIFSSQHNRVVHDPMYPRLCNSLFKKIYKISDKIIIFSEGGKKDLELFITPKEAEAKAYYIPPVNYIGSYPYMKHDWITALQTNNKMTVMFAGSLNHPYKNVDMVVDIAKEMKDRNIQFVFAGRLKGDEQLEYYSNKIKGYDNISAEFRYLDDNEMAQILEIADLVIMPYNVESISNSGTARMAFSYARTIICPMIPSLENIPVELIYTYEDGNDRKQKVTAQILKAYNDYCIDKESLHEKGEKLKKIMEERNSPEVVSARYIELFKLYK